MSLDDRASVTTSEGLELQMTLAGLGSRFGAAVIDTLILAILVVLTVFGFGAVAEAFDAGSVMLLGALGILAVSLVVFGYFIAFEVLNDGRTPGKSVFGIRVAGIDGRPVDFTSSVVRNLLRIVDLLPSFYLIGAVTILASTRNQRLGDLAAQTLVVRQRTVAGQPLPPGAMRAPARTTWDVSAITAEDAALIGRYLGRRRSLDVERRAQLAEQIAGKLRPKVGGVDERLDDESFLETVLATKQARADQS